MLTLEDAIRRMTSLPARTFSLKERGLVKPDMAADLVLFDPARVEDKATFPDPHQYSEGFDIVIVNGRVAVENGKLTEARAGKGGPAAVMIQLTEAGKRFGHKLLFQDLDWMITPKDHVGLVGANGTGKSTLLKIIGRIRALDYGSLTIAKGVSAGYLPQDGLSLVGKDGFCRVHGGFLEVHEIEEELETLTHRMAEIDPASEEYPQWPTDSIAWTANFVRATVHH